MARKRKYTDEDRAAVYVALQVNKGNVARTSKETLVPEATVREWKKRFVTDPPDLETTEAVLSDFTTTAERVRDKLIKSYEAALDAGKVNPDKMPVHIGIFVDKVQLLRGLATSRQEQLNGLPSTDQVRELATGVFDAMRLALVKAEQREAIIDGEFTEVVEQPEGLPAPTDKE